MSNLTAGNRLYLYQLLRREIGVGRQTLLSRVEEVLAADGMTPGDLGYDSVRELLESLGGMVKITVFKKGNAYATLVQNDEWDRMLEQGDSPSAQQKAAAKGKPWKHRAKAKVIRPTKPRPARSKQVAPAPEPPEPVEPEPAESEPPAAAVAQATATEPDAPAEETQVEAAPTEPSAPTEALASANETSPTEPEEPSSAHAEPQPVPAAPHIRLTVTYDPYAGIEPDASEPAPERVAASPQPEPVYRLVDEAEESAVNPEPVLVGLPRDFAQEVYVPNGPLSLLYQLLPPDASPIDTLAQDWQVARSTRSYRGTRNLVSFGLHLAHADGSPVTVTLRRTTRPASGKHWALVAVDGRDGSTPPAEEAGAEELHEAGTPVERLLARNIELGPWEEALRALADVAEPEPWDLPGHPGERGVLRLYLAMTYRSVLEQDLLVTSADSTLGIFDTGLLSPLSEHVYACLAAQSGSAPWRLLGFSTTGEGDLGSQLATISKLPPAPRYLSGFGDLLVQPGSTVTLPRRLARELGEDAGDLVAATVCRCAADWRLVAPGVDIATGDLRLLLPLGTTANPATATRALPVGRGEDGGLTACGSLGLSLARVEARAVSRSMPAWLAQAQG